MKKLSIINNIEQDDRILSQEKNKSDDTSETSLRPKSWDNYIGQEKIKRILQVSIQASKKRSECLDHILFFGPPGLGKTTLSHIIANEMGANIKVSAAPMIEKAGDLAAIMTNLNDGDVLFIDEIHRLSPAIEEILYPAMEDFRLDIIVGQGAAAQTLKIDLRPFTLIGATTRAGMLSNPLRDRFGITAKLEFYSVSELAEIIKRACKTLNYKILDDSASEIAKRSRGTPRIALRLLKRVRDFAQVQDMDVIDCEITRYALGELGVNDLGFDEMDLRYLEILCGANGRAIGLNTLAAAMSEDEGTIEDVIEPYLLANGYIERTAKGRIATYKSANLFGKKDSGLF
ncbi:Holliday junction branch migration DNA helicase RuvB [Helicobacter saguini]|uniref:Holliday junction branch migration complex subunit RuvB n=1 Tax=Helicobacter saguini TaxID=1548018 RepID=A0A347VT32_9HELI|nr:Holliday junction branch migration DNA helicase RuvB [Helicobacter saguini]MWV62258.1 Holliday junction branch migration DNA helicase RuvB [Helicobacter saguini]MWV67069.1 Holliday junction branch migration DNA helicase RuvB [Helicobacter saguini]MWV69419.1 Holliday junction branch migration DNA helicase RuvB [Helicobacter saguini]MWV71027.1 Holliday junction branch migration DNA helicase RuvB [Helicobacter saguini]TLD95067.1 Holliday junction branch migration DNA helicase RuvB [Helicobacte